MGNLNSITMVHAAPDLPVPILPYSESLERKKNIVRFSLGFYAPTLLFCTGLLHHNATIIKNPYLATAVAIPAVLMYTTNYLELTRLISDDMYLSKKENNNRLS